MCFVRGIISEVLVPILGKSPNRSYEYVTFEWQPFLFIEKPTK